MNPCTTAQSWYVPISRAYNHVEATNTEKIAQHIMPNMCNQNHNKLYEEFPSE